METFFKRVGIGAIVVITSPLWAAYFCLYVIYGSLMILLVPIRFIESLFTDKKLKIKNHYDEEAAAILHQQEESGPMPGAPLNTNTQPNNYPNGYNNIPPQNNYSPYNGYPQNTNTNYNQTNQNYNNNYSQNNYPNYPGQDNNGRGGNR